MVNTYTSAPTTNHVLRKLLFKWLQWDLNHDHLVCKQSQPRDLGRMVEHSLGCGFGSRCIHLNFRYRTCFEQGVPWNSGHHRVEIHSKRIYDTINAHTGNVLFSLLVKPSRKILTITVCLSHSNKRKPRISKKKRSELT